MSKSTALLALFAALSVSPLWLCRAEPESGSPASSARAALDARRWEEAVKLADRALAAEPGAGDARRVRGFARARLKDYTGSLADFVALVGADPADAASWHGAGKTLRLMSALPEGLAANERALALAPDTADYLIERGVNLFLSRNFASSSAAFERVHELRPEYPGINAYRAELFLFMKNAAMARAAAAEGAEREPGYGIHRINLAHAALFAGETEKAKALYLASADLIDMDGVTPGRALVPLDFAKMRAAGVTVPGMEEIEALLKK